MEEKRTQVRREAMVVVTIDAGPRKNRAAVTRNISSRGALLQSASRFSVGEKVVARFLDKNREITAVGRIVRAHKQPRGIPLRHVIAMRFDHDVEDIDRLESLRAR